jgi:actin-related protein 2
MDTRKALYENVVLSGANTMFPGFSARLESELRNLYKERVLKDKTKEMKIKLNIVDTSRRNYSVFIGACFLANFYANEEEYWITKHDWDEVGPKIIQQKCHNLII